MSKVCQNLYQQNVVLAQLITYSFFGKNIFNTKMIITKMSHEKIFSNVSYNHFHQQNSNKDLYFDAFCYCINMMYFTICLGLCWVYRRPQGTGSLFGSQSAYVRGKSMYGIFLLWKIIFFTSKPLFLSYIFCPFWHEYVGAHTHNNGNPASCSLCFWHRG
jgi:hypothetical protein